MTQHPIDVLTIGNAIYDVLAHVEDDFLTREGLVKGSMRLIDAEEAVRLYAKMGPAVRQSGGCAGNTASGVASLGGKAAFIGKVSEDEVGEAYGHDLRGFGVAFATSPLPAGAATPSGRSMILISPDGERTMNTFLGAANELTSADIDAHVVASAKVTYLEGYLWDPVKAKEAFRTAADIAHAHGNRVALTLSDSFCVDRYRGEFLDLLRQGRVDILFANEAELHALYETADFETAVAALSEDAALGVVTLGEKGALVVEGTKRFEVSARKVDRITDLTGAGDLFAAGFLFGLTRNYPHGLSAEIGTLAAGEVITHMGGRPETALKNLAEQAGMIGA